MRLVAPCAGAIRRAGTPVAAGRRQPRLVAPPLPPPPPRAHTRLLAAGGARPVLPGPAAAAHLSHTGGPEGQPEGACLVAAGQEQKPAR